MVTFGGFTHCGRRQSDRGDQRLITQPRTYQSERKENTDDHKHSNHERATEEASTGSGSTPPGPQVLLTLGSPTLEAFLSVTTNSALCRPQMCMETNSRTSEFPSRPNLG